MLILKLPININEIHIKMWGLRDIFYFNII